MSPRRRHVPTWVVDWLLILGMAVGFVSAIVVIVVLHQLGVVLHQL